MKKLVTSKVAGLWLMDLLKFELFDRYFLLIPQGIAIFRASFNDYFCYFPVSFSAASRFTTFLENILVRHFYIFFTLSSFNFYFSAC